jgi:Zn-dependent protease with chaperone function
LARRADLLLSAVAASIGVASGLLAMCVVASSREGRPRLTPDVVNVVVGVATTVVLGVVVRQLGRSSRPTVWFRRWHDQTFPVPPSLAARAAALALATGQPAPAIYVVDDDTVNASTAGAPGRARILITRGACGLDPEQLDALLAFALAQLADDELRLVRDVSSVVDLYTMAIKIAWALVIAGFVLAVAFQGAGPWVALAAGSTVGLVFLTPCAVFAAASALGLARAAGALTDSEAVSHTFRPDSYAELLIGMADDHRETDTRLAPMAWLERATTRRDLAALVGAHHSQEELEYRARRMCAIAGIDPPTRWARSSD